MREVQHGRRAVLLATVAMLTSGALPSGIAGAVPQPSSPDIGACSRIPEARSRPPEAGRPPVRPNTAPGMATGTGHRWSASVDADGWLRGHTLSLGDVGAWHAGPRAFADGPFGDTLITGERSPSGTRMRLIDIARGCTSRTVTVPSLVYGSMLLDDGSLVLSLVDRHTRAELGVWQVGPAATDRPRLIIAPPDGEEATAVPREVTIRRSGGGILARWCAAGTCIARGRSGLVSGHAALVDLDVDTDGTNALPLRSPRPVPVYDRWFPWSLLSFRFHGSETPPSWMREAVQGAADDGTDTSKSLSPIFNYVDSGANGVIRYTSSFPSGCSNAIACASHVGEQWALRMRPQGYDFRWGEAPMVSKDHRRRLLRRGTGGTPRVRSCGRTRPPRERRLSSLALVHRHAPGDAITAARVMGPARLWLVRRGQSSGAVRHAHDVHTHRWLQRRGLPRVPVRVRDPGRGGGPAGVVCHAQGAHGCHGLWPPERHAPERPLRATAATCCRQHWRLDHVVDALG